MRIDRVKLIAGALVLIVAATAAGTIYIAWFAPLTPDQRIAATASTLTAGAFVIAVLAGIIAVRAYSDALRRPKLTLLFHMDRYPEQAMYRFRLHNDGNGSATYVVAWIILPPDIRPLNMSPWEPEGQNRYRWEARAGLAIHPGSACDFALPVFTGSGHPSPVTVQFTIVADGARPFVGEATA